MTDKAFREATEHLPFSGWETEQCSVSVPCPFPSQNGTFRGCSVAGCVVFRAPRSKGAEHGTERHTTSQRPRLTKHGCGAWTLTALDARVAALTAWLDPYPLTAAGEVWAITDDRWTYLLLADRIEKRTRWTIPGRPAGSQYTVLAWHRCQQPVPLEHRRPPQPQPHLATSSKEPPF